MEVDPLASARWGPLVESNAMAATVIMTLSWDALGLAMTGGTFAAFGMLLHLFAFAGGLLNGFRHDATVDDRRHATQLLVGSGICALSAAALGAIALLLASFE
ncbi:hypothetical protein [Variovorax sp. UC122_21]|uniref:hypothetical protein n=1 Tax=Variovorax sp. UC122_21 TaxID=3374554 RepID=UPI0037576243